MRNVLKPLKKRLSDFCDFLFSDMVDWDLALLNPPVHRGFGPHMPPPGAPPQAPDTF